MQYRKLGKLDWEVSALGFGCMRLPTLSKNPIGADILEKEAIDMIRYAIDNGVNYVDTAYLYHMGQSEIVLGKALSEGYRDKVKIATKSPMMRIKAKNEYDAILDDQLKKLNVEMIDFYLFHGLNKKTWEIVKEQGLIERAEAAKKAGKIGHICFSFHDKYEVFEEIINGYDSWTLCQIQYNFMDTDIQAGTKGLKLAASKDIGIVVMEPLRGGKLANPISEVKDLLKNREYKHTLADLSLKWLWNQKEVSVLLSGMSNMNQVVENIKSADEAKINSLSSDEERLIEEIKDIYTSRGKNIPCTGCGYCMPCPQDINIPQVLNFYNEGVMYDFFDDSRRTYNLFGKPASKCVKCKECEEKCPQSIPISDWMDKIDDTLSS